MLFFLEKIKRETPKDAKLSSENRQNNAKFPEGMQSPCYPKHLLGSASLKEKNASTLATNCRRRVMVRVKMILIVILQIAIEFTDRATFKNDISLETK